jgi:hypothetical protein
LVLAVIGINLLITGSVLVGTLAILIPLVFIAQIELNRRRHFQSLYAQGANLMRALQAEGFDLSDSMIVNRGDGVVFVDLEASMFGCRYLNGSLESFESSEILAVEVLSAKDLIARSKEYDHPVMVEGIQLGRSSDLARMYQDDEGSFLAVTVAGPPESIRCYRLMYHDAGPHWLRLMENLCRSSVTAESAAQQPMLD